MINFEFLLIQLNNYQDNSKRIKLDFATSSKSTQQKASKKRHHDEDYNESEQSSQSVFLYFLLI